MIEPRESAVHYSQKAKVAVFPKGYINELSDGSMSLFDWIQLAGTLDVQGLELYPLFLKQRDETYLQEVKEAAARHGLEIPMMCSSPDFTHPDREFRAGQIEMMKQMIDVMSYLGPVSFRSCRVLSGQNRPGLDRKEAIRWTVESINELLPYAEQKQVYLVMENHYKDGFWHYPEFAQPAAIFLDIIHQIDSPWFGVNYDPSNTLLAGEDPLELLKAVKERILTMHASDRYLKQGYSLDTLKQGNVQGYSEALQHGVIGKGLNDYDAIFTELRSIRFRNWISIEDGVNGMEELIQSAHFLQQKVKQYLQ